MSYGANTNHKFLNIPNTTLFTYNAWDAFNTARLAQQLRREMEGPSFSHQWEYYKEWVQPLQYAVMEMEARGVPVHLGRRQQFAQKTARELFQSTERVREFARQTKFSFTDKFPNSDPQVRNFLFNHLGLKPAGRTKKGKGTEWSVDLKNLVRVLRKFRKKDEQFRPLIEALCHRSRLKTVYERYVTFPVRDGRVFPTVKMTGTKTFRYAYKDPALQQFPVETRFYLGGNGNLLVGIDYSQLEARILAILAGDQTSIDCFRRDEDVHALNARDLFGVPEDEWNSMGEDNQTPRRNHAKGFLYRISYGGEGNVEAGKEYCPCAPCMANVPPTMDLSRDDNLAAERRWFEAHKAVRNFQDDLIAGIDRDGYWECPLGPRRYVSQSVRSGRGRREALNIPMQLTGACIVNRAQVRLHRAGAPIFLQWHDAFYFEIPKGEPSRVVDQRIADYQGIMEEPVPELAGEVFPSDVEIGETLGKRKLGDPTGLRGLKRGASVTSLQ